MKIGITGTRNGMTTKQLKSFATVVRELPPFTEFHHGTCVGADEEAVSYIYELRTDDEHTFTIIGHPGNVDKFCSQKACSLSDSLDWPRPMLERNRIIVDAVDVLIVCPEGPEELRSGTWMTWRESVKQKKPSIIIYPNGSVVHRR